MNSQLTANGSIPPRPGNAFALFKEKLKIIAEFIVTDTSPSAVRAMWKSLAKEEKEKLTREAKENMDAFDKMYPDWKGKAPKNKEVATKMEDLKTTGQIPREVEKLSLAAGMTVVEHGVPMVPSVPREMTVAPNPPMRQPARQRVFPERWLAPAMSPFEPNHHRRIHISEVFANPGRHGRVCPQNHAILQRAGIQGTTEEENQNAVRMYILGSMTPHRYNPY